jgi:hypothetical protein
MKRVRGHGALLLILALCCLAQQEPPPAQTPLPIGVATLADFKGDVILRSPKGDALSPQRGLVLDPESTIETAQGSLLLSLQDGSQVLIKSHSRIVLKSPQIGQGRHLELLIGKIIATVQKRLGNPPPFRIGTPSAVITVRGTRFSVEVTKKNRTYVEVFEGVVEVQGLAAGARAVLVRPGFSSGVQQNLDPEQPREMIGQSEFGGPGDKPGTENEREGQQRNKPTGHEKDNSRPD